MIKRVFNLLPALLAIILAGSCANRIGKETSEPIRYNQVGYQTNSQKLALVADGVTEVVMTDVQGSEVFRTTPPPAVYWEASGDAVSVVDFSSVNKPGHYTLSLSGINQSFEINIADQPYNEVARAALKAFYFNRSAMPIEEAFGGQWARPAGHPDSLVMVHASAASEARPEGTILSSPLGWYDAGDYNKYVVNSGITTYTLLRAFTDFQDYFKTLDVNIPESGDALPDLLNEILYNYQWVLTMQDPNNGGVYHKLTTKQFEGFVMPHEAINQRYVVQKSTTAALNFAALAAKGYRTFKELDQQLPGLAEASLKQAEYAWQWAVNHPNVEYIQPQDIGTGAYDDQTFDDEWFWAASELWLATGKPGYLDTVLEKYAKPQVPTWNQTYALGVMSLLNNLDILPEALLNTNLKNDFLTLAEELTEVSKTSPYAVSISKFAWGSNSDVANQGMLKLFAYKISGNEEFLTSALSDLDYILGRNATGYCFVTGFGTKKVMNIHHRPSGADGIEEPVPGFLAGGPNLSVLPDCDPLVKRSPFPAKSYVDLECSYSTNEIAINWNAPLVYLASGIDALTTR